MDYHQRFISGIAGIGLLVISPTFARAGYTYISQVNASSGADFRYFSFENAGVKCMQEFTNGGYLQQEGTSGPTNNIITFECAPSASDINTPSADTYIYYYDPPGYICQPDGGVPGCRPISLMLSPRWRINHLIA
jgi:hypothetical protein